MGSPPIALTNLVYRYGRADRPAVDGLDLTLAEGEILGLLGPNGAGKTTTLHAILGLLAPTSGRVAVFGLSPIADRARVMSRLNFASVDVDLPSNLLVDECLSIFAQLYGVHREMRYRDELMERFQLIALRRQRIGTLSAGEQMRLKLCKALLNRPELLILDEPTLNLDPYMAQTVRELLKTIQRERRMSILHTSHNMPEVESFCDRICFLHQGRMLAEGAPQEILARVGSRSLNELFIRVATSGDLYHAG